MSVITAAPTLKVTTPEQILYSIETWEHWDTIGLVAQKEYGLSPEEFASLLPEYQKFIGLIVCGHHGVGMFSERVDKVWHAHILSTNLYEQFCTRMNGAFIHHFPNLDRSSSMECTKPEDICTTKCSGSCKTPPPKCTEEKYPTSFASFESLYRSTYGMPLPAIWDISEIDGVASPTA